VRERDGVLEERQREGEREVERGRERESEAACLLGTQF